MLIFNFTKQINKNFTSNESLHNKSFNESSQPVTPTSTIHANNNAHTFSSTDLKELSNIRRNTLANCCPEAAAVALNQEIVKKENALTRQAMEKSMSLGKTEQKSLLNIFMKVSGSQTKLNSLEELSQNLSQFELEQSEEGKKNPIKKCAQLERQSSINTQLRHKLYKRIKRSLRKCDLNGQELDLIEGFKKDYVPNKAAQTKQRRNPREMWKYAIRQQILLNKMNQQNKHNDKCQATASENRAKIDYDEIPRIESHQQLEKLFTIWDRLIKYQAKEPKTNLEEEIYQAIRDGVPRHRKRDVWQFVVAFRQKDKSFGNLPNKPQTNKMYRNLLKQLAVQQHAIFVDLGRTFPGITFFAETMGPGQLSLYNLLKAYSLYDKEVEYCQGLSFVAGILLLHVRNMDYFINDI